MSTEKNIATVRRLFQELDKRNLDVLDEICASDFLNHYPAFATGSDRVGLKQSLSVMHKSFSDYKRIVEYMIAEGKKVVYPFTMRGTGTVVCHGDPTY